ncbi:unnamed protein product, partial [Prunus brigantina]
IIKYSRAAILLKYSLVAGISLVCISYNLRKYGIRRLLFVDRYHGYKLRYCDEYIQKINVSLAIPIAPLFNFFPFSFYGCESFMFLPDSNNSTVGG